MIMPNLIGQNIAEATATLIASGVIQIPSWYQFEPWPVKVTWRNGTQGLVSAQSPAAGATVAFNTSINLTVGEPPTGVIYP